MKKDKNPRVVLTMGLGIASLIIAVFLSIALQYVTVNLNWFLGFTAFAYIAGISAIVYCAKQTKSSTRRT